MRPWKELTSTVLHRFRIFSLSLAQFESPRTGKPVDAVVIDTPDWINVVALTPERDVVLIEQFRFATRSITLEIPGGIIDPGETPYEAARRELLEETGYEAERWTPLGCIEPNPAILNNRCHTFLAEDCRPTRQQALDAGEDIHVLTRPLTDVPRLLASGTISHALVGIAFQKLELHRQGHQPTG